MGSRQIGFASIKVSALAFEGGVREWFTLIHDQDEVGKILLETKVIQPHESTKASFAALLSSKRAMLRAELLPFFQIEDIKSLLLLSKESSHLIKEHFVDGYLSYEQIINLLGSGVHSISHQDLAKLAISKDEEEDKEEH